MSNFMSLGQAAPVFGFRTGTALRKAFERGLLPGRFLVRIGPRTLRVDVPGLEAHIRKSPAYGPAPAATEVKP